MSTTIYLKSSQDNGSILDMVKSAIEAEITRLELALELAARALLYRFCRLASTSR